LRAIDLPHTKDIEHSKWRFSVLDETSRSIMFPTGSMGDRWANEDKNKGKWKISNICSISGKEISPVLTLLGLTERQ